MRKRILPLALGSLALLSGGLGAASADEQSVPDLDERIDSYQQERREEGEQLNPATRETVQRSMEQVREELPDPGLKVGAEAPGFRLPNAFGEPISLAEYLKKGPVVLTFYRGAWCPYCNLELRALKESLPAFRKHGARVLAVTPQKPGRSLEQVKEDGFPFEILSDLDSRVMRDYRLLFQVPEDLVAVYKRELGLDLADYNGDGRHVLPVPGTFVIDRQGIVRAAFAEVDYKQRMEPTAILKALRRLPAPEDQE
ncbi:peroxiredoxin-like family protein [Thiohalorhabdus methylotrophus]|uniref:thioredoxin-dependent peroxiredoxin n=1 Tax=Thiohalorhabdus methylotrophus TaxID=3242694 RepID=A0ABV4TZQ2_9GAMM